MKYRGTLFSRRFWILCATFSLVVVQCPFSFHISWVYPVTISSSVTTGDELRALNAEAVTDPTPVAVANEEAAADPTPVAVANEEALTDPTHVAVASPLSGPKGVLAVLHDLELTLSELSGKGACSRNAKRTSQPYFFPKHKGFIARANNQAGHCYAKILVAFAFYGPRLEARLLWAILAEESWGSGPYRADRALGA